MTIHTKCFREFQKELPSETNIHCIRIVAKFKLFHLKHDELFSLNQESRQELCALGTEPHRQTRISFFLCRAHPPLTIMHFRRRICNLYLSPIFACVHVFRVFLNPAFRKCLKQVICFYWCILNLLQLRKTTFTIYNKNAKYIAYALDVSSYRSVHEKSRVIKVKAI